MEITPKEVSIDFVRSKVNKDLQTINKNIDSVKMQIEALGEDETLKFQLECLYSTRRYLRIFRDIVFATED